MIHSVDSNGYRPGLERARKAMLGKSDQEVCQLGDLLLPSLAAAAPFSHAVLFKTVHDLRTEKTSQHLLATAYRSALDVACNPSFCGMTPALATVGSALCQEVLQNQPESPDVVNTAGPLVAPLAWKAAEMSSNPVEETLARGVLHVGSARASVLTCRQAQLEGFQRLAEGVKGGSSSAVMADWALSSSQHVVTDPRFHDQLQSVGITGQILSTMKNLDLGDPVNQNLVGEMANRYEAGLKGDLAPTPAGFPGAEVTANYALEHNMALQFLRSDA